MYPISMARWFSSKGKCKLRILVLRPNGLIPYQYADDEIIPRNPQLVVILLINDYHKVFRMVEQELPTLPEHLSSPSFFSSGVRVARSSVF